MTKLLDRYQIESGSGRGDGSGDGAGWRLAAVVFGSGSKAGIGDTTGASSGLCTSVVLGAKGNRGAGIGSGCNSGGTLVSGKGVGSGAGK